MYKLCEDDYKMCMQIRLLWSMIEEFNKYKNCVFTFKFPCDADK